MAPRVAQLGAAGEEHLGHDEPRGGEVRAAMPRRPARTLLSRNPVVLGCWLPMRRPLRARVRVGSLTMTTTTSTFRKNAIAWPALSAAKDECAAGPIGPLGPSRVALRRSDFFFVRGTRVRACATAGR